MSETTHNLNARKSARLIVYTAAWWLLQSACGPKSSATSVSEASSAPAPITSTATEEHTSTTGDVPTSGNPTMMTTPATDSDDGTMSSSDGSTTTDNPFFPDECMSPGRVCRSGFKCVPYGPNPENQGCFPVPRDPDAVREPCSILQYENGVLSALDSCDAFSICFNGQCSPICSMPELSCPEGFSQCFINPPLEVCIPFCDPLNEDCGPGRECTFASSYFSCGPAGEDKALWEECSGSNDCSPGEVCSPAALANECMGLECCNQLCALDTGLCPGVQQECVPFFMNGEGAPEYDNLGICST